MIKRFLLFTSLLLTPVAMHAQVAPAAKGGFSNLWVGGEYSTFNPDYNLHRLTGIGVYADYDITHKLSAEAEARFLGVITAQDGNETQKDYLIGARYVPIHWRRFSPYVKLLAGGVWIQFPGTIGNGSYFAYAPGGGVDYRISNRFSARADYEYQVLPSAPNIPNQSSNGLTPNGFSFGVAYRVF